MMQQMLVGLGGGGVPVFVDDVFKTKLYTGTAAYGLAVTTGLDYTSGESLIWTKRRIRNDSYDFDHILTNTGRGRKWLVSNKTDGENTTPVVLSLTSTGYTVDTSGTVNKSGDSYVSWNFKESPGFLDIVQFTGNGSSGLRSINHDLKSTPAFIIARLATGGSQWYCWHKDLTSKNHYILLNGAGAEGNAGAQVWDATDTTFSIHSGIVGNTNNSEYIAYLFADEDARFGTNSNESIIKCGIFPSSETTTVDMGFEPGWILLKGKDSNSNWAIFDSTRGFGTSSSASSKAKRLSADLSGPEYENAGFWIESGTPNIIRTNGNFSTSNFIYVCISKP